jgi:hydrogenase maturation protease
MSEPRILIAGVGNIFLGDDAFGVEVARQLAGRPQPAGVQVTDFGIRGFDLALALLDGWDLAVLVDATPRGGRPGTLYVIEPEPPAAGAEKTAVEPHGLDPVKVLQLVRSLGGQSPPLRVVGCEPAAFGTEEEPAMGLSPPVQAAVAQAVVLVEKLVAAWRAGVRPVLHQV